MVFVLFNGDRPVVCERANWKTCPEHKGLSSKPPKGYKFGSGKVDDVFEEQVYLSRGRLGETVISADEFDRLSAAGVFTVPVGLSIDEMMGADMDRLTAIFGDMIAGVKYSRDDVVLFSRNGVVDDGVVVFDVTYERKGSVA